jgi:hypothetical protein
VPAALQLYYIAKKFTTEDTKVFSQRDTELLLRKNFEVAFL